MSAPGRREEIDAHLSAALDLPAAERDSYLDRACGNDEELRRSVQALLLDAEGTSTFVRQGGGLWKSIWDEISARSDRERTSLERLQSGHMLSHYRLVAPIGEGGMGIVWKAFDSVLGRPVAIKVLPLEASVHERRRGMLLQEARLASSISDWRVVQVHEFASDGDLDFIVMEYIEGESLDRVLRGGPVSARRTVEIGREVASALSRAHGKGLLHRDLKPSNILVTPEGDVKVVDFGLATSFTDADHAAEEQTHVPLHTTESRLTTRAGTPAYMSPEQVRGDPLDVRSDIFSLGAVLYESATGRSPFRGASLEETFDRVLEARPAPPREVMPEIPPDLDRIIRKALAGPASDRYQTMEDLAIDLRRLGADLESRPSPSSERYGKALGTPGHWSRKLAAGGACMLLLALLPWVGWSKELVLPQAAADARRVFIAPLQVHGQSEGGDYVGHAFAEAIGVNLAQLEALDVLPVPDSDRWAALGADGGLVAARDARTGSLITGSLTRSAGAYLLEVTLLDTGRNRIRWGDQREIAEGLLPIAAASLAQAMTDRIGVSRRRQYDYLHLTGGAATSASPELAEALGGSRGLQCHATAATRPLLEAFPEESDAHVLWLAACFLDAWDFGADSPERRAYDSAARELRRIDPDNPWDDRLDAMFAYRDERTAEAVERLSMILSRNDLTPAARANILSVRSTYRARLGDRAGAMADMEEALRLNPTDDVSLAFISQGLSILGRWDEALGEAEFRAIVAELERSSNGSLPGD